MIRDMSRQLPLPVQPEVGVVFSTALAGTQLDPDDADLPGAYAGPVGEPGGGAVTCTEYPMK